MMAITYGSAYAGADLPVRRKSRCVLTAPPGQVRSVAGYLSPLMTPASGCVISDSGAAVLRSVSMQIIDVKRAGRDSPAAAAS